MKYRIWVNDDGTVLVRLWDNGVMQVAERPTRDHVWGPPQYLLEQDSGTG